MSEKKTLVPELLPQPVIRSKTGPDPRERVQRHLRTLMRFGAAAGTAALASCGYMVVDPLPPPAKCEPLGGPDANVSASELNGNVTVNLTLNHPYSQDGAWTVGNVEGLTGATLVSKDTQQLYPGFKVDVVVTPNAGAQTVQFDLPVQCTNQTTSMFERARVVVQLANADGGSPTAPTATVTFVDITGP